jgi:hypothetical protein
MKKIFIFIFLLSFSSQSYAYDCSFDKIKPGVTSKSLEEINIFAYGAKSSLEAFNYTISSEQLCKGDPENFVGQHIELMFMGDKLVKVNYINTIPNKSVLFDLANEYYKTNFKRNGEQVTKKQSEFYQTNINNISFFYVLLKNKDQQQEYLEISSDKDIKNLEKFLLKIEETQ